MKKLALLTALSLTLSACGTSQIDFSHAQIVDKKIYSAEDNKPFTGEVTNIPFGLIQSKSMGTAMRIYTTTTGDDALFSSLIVAGVHSLGNVQQSNSLLLCDAEVSNGHLDGTVKCHLAGKDLIVIEAHYSQGNLDGKLIIQGLAKDKQSLTKGIEAQTKNNQLNGDLTIWDGRTGNQVYHVVMANDLPEGEAVWNGANGRMFRKEFYENGILTKVTNYDPKTGKELGTSTHGDPMQVAQQYKLDISVNKTGIIDGVRVIYQIYGEQHRLLDEPKIIEIAEYHNAVRDGKSVQYAVQEGSTVLDEGNSGTILAELTYKNGQPFNGVSAVLERSTEKGQHIKKIEYIDGKTKEEIEREQRLKEERAMQEQQAEEQAQQSMSESNELIEYNQQESSPLDWNSQTASDPELNQ